MKNILFLLSLVVSLNSLLAFESRFFDEDTPEEVLIARIETVVQESTERIDELEKLSDDLSELLLDSYVQRGVGYLMLKEYELGLADFHTVLRAQYKRDQMQHPLVRLALNGTVLCHLLLDQTEAVLETFEIIDYYFPSEIDLSQNTELCAARTLSSPQFKLAPRQYLDKEAITFPRLILGDIQIDHCIMEYPTPAELRETRGQYENERLERIHKDYKMAIWQEEQFGIPADHQQFQKELEKLAKELGIESVHALLSAIGESMLAGGAALQFPIGAVIGGIQAVQDFKKFGACAVEAERVRSLSDRWGK